MKSKLSTGKKGAINELRVAIDLTERGYDVFRALAQSCPCDLIAMKDGVCSRVEVTTGFQGTKGLLYDKHNPENFDVMAVVFDGHIYYFPELEVIRG